MFNNNNEEFWIVLDSNIATTTYGHQHGNSVILRVSGSSSTAECMMIVPDSEIVDTGNGHILKPIEGDLVEAEWNRS